LQIVPRANREGSFGCSRTGLLEILDDMLDHPDLRGSSVTSPRESFQRAPKLLVELCECHLIGGNRTQLPVHFEGLCEVVQRTDIHEVVHGELIGCVPDDVRVRVSQKIRDIRTEQETHGAPAIREFGPTRVESLCAPIHDAADTAATPENVAWVEVAVSEDVF
jgi:hypothetical protein